MSTAVVSPAHVLEQLNWRYATKQFDPTQTIPDDVWHALEQSLVLTPSSFGLQPWKFFVVRNPNIRQKLVEHSWGQRQVVDASHLVVLTIKKDVDAAYVDEYVQRMADVQGIPVENLEKFGNVVKGFMDNPPYPLDLNAWSTRQVYIALGFYMFAAAALGIDTCPMEGFVPSKYDEVLGLTDKGYATVVVCPAGYRSADDKSAARPKIRFETEKMVEYVD
ncbi:MAG: nitroreductase family protein [Cyanobacteria bacterium J06635_15]